MKSAKNKPKRRSNAKFDHDLFLRVIERVRSGEFTRKAIIAEGIHPGTFYDHLGDKPDYYDTLKKAQLAGPVNVAEQELYRRGVKGYLKPVYQQGIKVGAIREYDTTALIFFLKAANPSRFARLDGGDTTVTVSQGTQSPALAAAEARNAELLNQFQSRRAAQADTCPTLPAQDTTQDNAPDSPAGPLEGEAI